MSEPTTIDGHTYRLDDRWDYWRWLCSCDGAGEYQNQDPERSYRGWLRHVEAKQSRTKAGQIEVLVPILDELWADLLHMHASTAIDLNTWPAAHKFVQAWIPKEAP